MGLEDVLEFILDGYYSKEAISSIIEGIKLNIPKFLSKEGRSGVEVVYAAYTGPVDTLKIVTSLYEDKEVLSREVIKSLGCRDKRTVERIMLVYNLGDHSRESQVMFVFAINKESNQ